MIKQILMMILIMPLLVQANEYCDAYKAFEKNDLVSAKKELDPLAFKADTKAQNLLAVLNLRLGNNAAALKWFQSAGSKGELKAAYNLGVYFYLLGNSVKAQQWMHKAQALNEAQFALGVLYANHNLSKAKAYFASAAKEQNSMAQSHLCALVQMNPTPKDQAYESMCQADIAHELYQTGKFYSSPKKYGSLEKAIFYLKAAADRGDVEAMNLLGEMYYKRRGASDEEKALSYFEKAAENGNIDAKVNAAWIYYTGVKWSRRPQKGFEMLNRAMAKGSTQAKLYMGILYIRGHDFSYGTVLQDTNKGYALIRESANKGNLDAMKYLINNTRISQEELEAYQEKLRLYEQDQAQKSSLHFLYEGC